MSTTVVFENTLLKGSGKKGILMPIEPGGDYYRINGGGFNLPNEAGIVYPFNPYLQECIGPDSDWNRRITRGQVHCEVGHPPQYYFQYINGQIVRTQITDVLEWIHRLRFIDLKETCGFIRKCNWEFVGGPRYPIYVTIEVRALGPYSDILSESLKDPSVNTAFSMRTVTRPQKMGDRERQVEYLSTFDLVPEPGMRRACKHLSAGLEDFLSSSIAYRDAVVECSYDEMMVKLKHYVEQGDALGRFAGTESHDHLIDMYSQLKKNGARNEPVKVVRGSSLSAFM